MAIDKCFVAPPTTSLVDEQTQTFFPLRIPWAHWQLRHFLSNPASATPLSSRDREAQEETLYYASSDEVYCLNTRSRVRKHLATLPFEARCTASGYGWMCIGGECSGRFVALRVDGSSSFAEVDDRIDSGTARMQNRRAALRRAADVKVDYVGEDIVNSISVHRLTCPTSHLEDVVAVLTNNDKTVRMYSLTLGQETCVKDLPFAMNHATISPCGTMMVAVGDEPQAFFFRREMKRDPPPIPKPHNRLNSDSVDWRLSNTFDLHVTPGDQHHPKGYFTTAWSPNSKLCAVGSEGGYITVFDTDLLSASVPGSEASQHAIVAIASGSRPDLPLPHAGAIRSMLFSPQPFDLLFWNEDQGRMCVGDLRTGLQKRQVVDLETKSTAHKGEYTDFDDSCEDEPMSEDRARLADLIMEAENRAVDRQLEIDRQRRMGNELDDEPSRLGNRSNASRDIFASQYIDAHRRRRQREVFSPREQQLLDSLRTARQREEHRAATNGSTVDRINYTSSDMFSPDSNSRRYRLDDTTTNSQLRRARATLTRTYGIPPSALDTPLDFPSTVPVENDDDNANDQDLPFTEGDVYRDPAWRQLAPIIARDRRSPRLRASINFESISISRELWRQYSQMPAAPPSYTSRDAAWLINRASRGVSGNASAAAALAVREMGPRMTGLALSHDGRTVYAACEDGIFEIKVNVFGRMFWDSVELR